MDPDKAYKRPFNKIDVLPLIYPVKVTTAIRDQRSGRPLTFC